MNDEGRKGQGVPPSSSKASMEDSLSSRQAADPLSEIIGRPFLYHTQFWLLFSGPLHSFVVISGMFQTENRWTHVLGQLPLWGVCAGCCSSPGVLVSTGVLLPPPLPLPKPIYYLFYWLCFLNIISAHLFLSVKPLIQEAVTVAQAKPDHQLFYKVLCENSHTPSCAYSL